MTLRLVPDGLAARFALLLGAALIVANLVALGLLSFERLRLGRAAVAERELERIVSLVPAIEAVRPQARNRIARDASTRFSRVSVDPEPVVEANSDAPRSSALTAELARALPEREVRAAILVRRDRAGPPDGRAGRESVAISIRLTGADRPQWLNLVALGPPRRGPAINLGDDVFWLYLGLSLASVLGVSWVFLRHLTRPLTHLAEATRAAGQGDRGIRVPEAGSREMRSLAAAFNDMQARIARFDAERMRTLAAVGHDLRTPITSLRIRAEMLDEAEAGPMIRTLDEMTVMADGLVAYAKGAAQAEETQRFDLATLLRRIADERGAEMRPAAAVVIAGQKVALTRALGNLVDNALRYGGAARLKLETTGKEAIVTVEDDGPGIPHERLDAMFEPFVRGDDSRSQETGGAGLGLSIARNIVLAHGGTLELRNRAAGGLVAVATLPVRGA